MDSKRLKLFCLTFDFLRIEQLVFIDSGTNFLAVNYIDITLYFRVTTSNAFFCRFPGCEYPKIFSKKAVENYTAEVKHRLHQKRSYVSRGKYSSFILFFSFQRCICFIYIAFRYFSHGLTFITPPPLPPFNRCPCWFSDCVGHRRRLSRGHQQVNRNEWNTRISLQRLTALSVSQNDRHDFITSHNNPYVKPIKFPFCLFVPFFILWSCG